MIRLTLLGSSVVLGLAAWLVAADGSATAQPDTRASAGIGDLIDPGDALSPTALSPTMIGRCMEVAREVDPDLAARLEAIRRDRSEQDFRRAMAQARHLVGLARLKEQDPKLYGVKVAELRLDAQVNHLMDQLIEARRASSPAAAELEKQLEALVQRQVGYSIIARGFYLQQLDEHVKSLRDELDQDITNFGPAVQRRYHRLLDRVSAAVAAE